MPAGEARVMTFIFLGALSTNATSAVDLPFLWLVGWRETRCQTTREELVGKDTGHTETTSEDVLFADVCNVLEVFKRFYSLDIYIDTRCVASAVHC